MNDPLQTILETQAKQNLFAVNSRYYGSESASYETPTGTTVSYILRRFLPDPVELSEVQEHTVRDGDRPDNLASQYFGDPELFWRMCDANEVMHPNELIETIGRKLRITLPEGFKTTTNE